MSSPKSHSPVDPAVPPRPDPAGDDGRAPRPFADRLRLLLILILLPVAAVTLPTLIVTGVFGQRAKPRTPPTATATTPEVNPLRLSLEKSAAGLLPAPPALSPDPVVVTVRADHLAARLDTISRQAVQFGGSGTEGLSTASEKRLSVDLPAGRADAFRQAVTSRAALASPAPPSAPAGRDYVEVIIRAAGEDE